MKSDYYDRPIEKDEQQKYLEKLLSEHSFNPGLIADVCCGGGLLTYYLSQIYDNARFELIDLNNIAIEKAMEVNGKDLRFRYSIDNVHNLHYPDNKFDLTFCWKTLSFLEQPQKALNELVRITKKDGYIFISSLFSNFHNDLYTKVVSRDYPECNYNTFCWNTIQNWLYMRVEKWEIKPFRIEKYLPFSSEYLKTYTLNTENGFIQLAGGMLLNWCVLIIQK